MPDPKFSPDGKTLTINVTVPPGPLADRLGHKVCLCDCCSVAAECEFVERTGQPSGWLCAECEPGVRNAP